MRRIVTLFDRDGDPVRVEVDDKTVTLLMEEAHGMPAEAVFTNADDLMALAEEIRSAAVLISKDRRPA